MPMVCMSLVHSTASTLCITANWFPISLPTFQDAFCSGTMKVNLQKDEGCVGRDKLSQSTSTSPVFIFSELMLSFKWFYFYVAVGNHVWSESCLLLSTLKHRQNESWLLIKNLFIIHCIHLAIFFQSSSKATVLWLMYDSKSIAVAKISF